MNHVNGYFYSETSVQCQKTLPSPCSFSESYPTARKHNHNSGAAAQQSPPLWVSRVEHFLWCYRNSQRPSSTDKSQGNSKRLIRSIIIENRWDDPKQKGERPLVHIYCQRQSSVGREVLTLPSTHRSKSPLPASQGAGKPCSHPPSCACLGCKPHEAARFL